MRVLEYLVVLLSIIPGVGIARRVARAGRFRIVRGVAVHAIRVTGLLLLAWVPSTGVGAQAAGAAGALPIAEALVEAFNRHDPKAMTSLVSPNFELYYVDEEGVADLAVSGPDQLFDEMTAYFETRPAVRSVIADAIDGPVYVSFREQIVGGRSSLAVYEIRDGLIRRVWYFPAE
jgi:hypothetical protein